MRKFYAGTFVGLFVFIISIVQASGQVIALPALNSPVSQDFNTLANSGTSSALPPGWFLVETGGGANANGSYAAGTGSSNAGDAYSLGANLSTERAIGSLRSGTVIPTIGASFQNNTGSIITSLQITYAGEQWRLGAVRTPPAPDRMDFQFSTNAGSLSSGTWTDADALDFTSPLATGTVGARDGNVVRAILTSTISGLSISPGATFWIRWNDFDIAPGADDALAIDDFSLTPQGVPANQPNLVFIPASLNFGEVNIGSNRTLTYMFDAQNLDTTVTTVTEHADAYSISLDGVAFGDTLVVADSTVIYVRFAPTADGLDPDSILHTNGEFTRLMPLTGSGYDPVAHIIPIASARAQSVGTKVTIAGRVTSADQLGSPSYLQDPTGGIPVFDFTLSNNVEIGDSLVVTGPIGVFQSQVQVSGSGISFFKADSTVRIPAPRIISINQLAANEGMLVTVQDVELVNKSFVFYPQSTERMSNGAVEADLRIDGDTDLPGLAKPQGIVDITGVVGRFQTSAQLLPRSREDVPGAIEPENPADSVSAENTFDVMNWNLEFLGAESQVYGEEFGPADEPLQVQNIAQVILSKAPDLIAVQEISSDTFFNQLVSQLPGYGSECSARYSHDFDDDGSFPPQKLCVIYNTSTVRVVSSRAMFEQLYDEERTGAPNVLAGIPGGDPESFWSSGRLPFLLTARVTINHVTERISFIDLHSKSGGSSLSDYNRRKYDMQALKDSLDAHHDSDQFVILGDINDDLDNSIVVGNPTPYKTIVDDTSRYSPISLALSLSGAKSTVSFNDVIDHQIISNELDEEYIPGSIQILAPFQMIANYGNTTSDHLPVISRYQFIAPEVSFAAVADTITEGDSLLVLVTVSRPVSADMTIPVNVSGSASYDDDFTTVPGSVASLIEVPIAAGSTSTSFRVESIDDTADETDESIILSILPSEGLLLSTQDTLTVTLLDNDLPTIAFADASLSIEETAGSQQIYLQLSSPQPTTSTVTIAVSHSRGLLYGHVLDYTTNPALRPHGRFTLTIPAGSTEAYFEFTPNRDLFSEGEETATFTITSVTPGITVGTPSSLPVHIIDVAPCLPGFALHPNPTHGRVNIWTLPVNRDNIVNGSMYDPGGNQIASLDGDVDDLSDAFTEALSGRRRGVYIIKLIQCEQTVFLRVVKL